MNSEKVKEIKKALELNEYYAIEYFPKSCEPKIFTFTDLLTLINELESENERLKQSNKNILFVNEQVIKQNEQLKDRIAELENGIAKSMLGCEFLPECTNEKLKQFAERLKEKCKELENKYSHLCKSKKEAMEETCRYQGVLAVKREIDETLKEFIEK